MARKDRSFTGTDIARLYCRNLTEEERAIAAALFDRCGEKDFDQLLLKALADFYKKDTTKSLFFEALADILAGGEDFFGGLLDYVGGLLDGGDETPLLPAP